jgi:hypothetical protein
VGIGLFLPEEPKPTGFAIDDGLLLLLLDMTIGRDQVRGLSMIDGI